MKYSFSSKLSAIAAGGNGNLNLSIVQSWYHPDFTGHELGEERVAEAGECADLEGIVFDMFHHWSSKCSEPFKNIYRRNDYLVLSD
jgi:hypothetical protein